MSLLCGNRILSWLIVLCLVGFIFGSYSLNRTLDSNGRTTRKKSLISLLYTSNGSFFNPEWRGARNICRWLRGMRHQRKICERRRELPKILWDSKQMALEYCQQEFRYEQWNCSSKLRKRYFKKAYRETAFMYSLASATLMYKVAQACMMGKFKNCQCGPIKPAEKLDDEKWGECSVNAKFASKFVEKFLQLKLNGDTPSNVMNYNARVGLKVVRKQTYKKCKCHGVSGSCTSKICWYELRPFEEVVQQLKYLYHRAVQVEADNYVHQDRQKNCRKELIFLDPSPYFCDPGRMDLSISGRKCKDVDNCATLCCGNDYVSVIGTVKALCDCVWKESERLELNCVPCHKEEISYYCK